MGSPKYVDVHWKRVENKAEECSISESLELFPEQAVKEMIASAMEDVGAQSSRRKTRKIGLDGFNTEECSAGTRR